MASFRQMNLGRRWGINVDNTNQDDPEQRPTINTPTHSQTYSERFRLVKENSNLKRALGGWRERSRNNANTNNNDPLNKQNETTTTTTTEATAYPEETSLSTNNNGLPLEIVSENDDDHDDDIEEPSNIVKSHPTVDVTDAESHTHTAEMTLENTAISTSQLRQTIPIDTSKSPTGDDQTPCYISVSGTILSKQPSHGHGGDDPNGNDGNDAYMSDDESDLSQSISDEDYTEDLKRPQDVMLLSGSTTESTKSTTDDNTSQKTTSDDDDDIDGASRSVPPTAEASNNPQRDECRLENELISLKLELAQCRGIVDELQFNLQQVSKERDDLQTKLSSATCTISNLNTFTEELQEERQVLLNEVTNLRAEHDDVQKSHARVKREHWEFRQKVERMTASTTEMTYTIQMKEAVIEELEQSNQLSKDDVQSLTLKNEELTAQKTELNGEISSLKSQVQSLTQSNKTYETTKQSLEFDLHNLTTAVSSLEDDKKKLLEEKRRYAEENDQLTTELELLGQTPTARRRASADAAEERGRRGGLGGKRASYFPGMFGNRGAA